MKLLLGLLAVVGASASSFDDCTPSSIVAQGPFAPATFANHTYTDDDGDHIIYSLVPAGTPPTDAGFPLVAFMHGSTGQWEMYADDEAADGPVYDYASHGFVVVFPFIKNPYEDTKPLTTNTDGTYLLKAIEFAKQATADPSSELYGKVNVDSVVVAGHSMGASCAIMAGTKIDAGDAKLVVAQHPGICGPIGPPPWPATWMKSDLEELTGKHPYLVTTATNDGAFWPAPKTAEHEYGCFGDGVNATGLKSSFVQFSEAACTEDGARDPFDDGGHCCPMRFEGGGAPETPWVLAAMKLYAQLDGDVTSNCYSMLYANSTDSLYNSPDAELVDLRN